VFYLFVVAVFSRCGHLACKFVTFSDLHKLIGIWQIVAKTTKPLIFDQFWLMTEIRVAMVVVLVKTDYGW